MEATFTLEGIDKIQRAIRRSPLTAATEIQKFLVRSGAVVRATVMNSPWNVGAGGGGSPVAAEAGGNMRDTHRQEIANFQYRLIPMAPYAGFVHDGTSKMKARPWLKYALDTNESKINKIGEQLVAALANDLAK